MKNKLELTQKILDACNGNTPEDIIFSLILALGTMANITLNKGKEEHFVDGVRNHLLNIIKNDELRKNIVVLNIKKK